MKNLARAQSGHSHGIESLRRSVEAKINFDVRCDRNRPAVLRRGSEPPLPHRCRRVGVQAGIERANHSNVLRLTGLGNKNGKHYYAFYAPVSRIVG